MLMMKRALYGKGIYLARHDSIGYNLENGFYTEGKLLGDTDPEGVVIVLMYQVLVPGDLVSLKANEVNPDDDEVCIGRAHETGAHLSGGKGHPGNMYIFKNKSSLLASYILAFKRAR